ncbi:MAG: hypothetical protein A3J74_05335 [Elusimicrobia bacterium RIFCSPHIGHO2_02_FULL_57_9]|nr:MAG: hypothetical protein A3J74_05335 [Elusimicrobia bacterium RIFCSPHIGHO2_02_FULL_57_9]
MKTFLKILGVCLILFALVLAAAPFILKKYFPPEKIRELVVSNAGKSLGRQVRLGDVSFSLLKGLTLKNLEISEYPDFSAGTFAASEAFSLQIQWLPLLRKKIAVDKMDAKGLKLSIIKEKEGVYNFSNLSSSGPVAASPSPAESQSPVELSIRRAGIAGGTIYYKDKVIGDTCEFGGIKLDLKNFRMQGSFDADLSLAALGQLSGRPVNVGINFLGRLDLGGRKAENMWAQIKSLSVQWPAATRRFMGPVLTAKFSGSIKNITAPEVDIKASLSADKTEILDLEFEGKAVMPGPQSVLSVGGDFGLKTPGFNPTELKGIISLPDIMIPPLKTKGKMDYQGDNLSISSWRLESSFGALDISGSVRGIGKANAADLNILGKFDIPELKSSDIPYARLPPGLVMPAMSLQAKGRIKNDQIDIQTLKLKTKGNDIEVEGKLMALKSARPMVQLMIQCRSFVLEELSRISAQTRNMNLSGRGSFAVAAKGPMNKPALDGEVRFQDLGAAIAGLRLSDFSGGARFNDKRIHLPNISGRVADGNLTMNLTVKNYTEALEVDLEADLNRLDLGKLLEANTAVKSANKTQLQSQAEPSAQASAPLSTKGELTVGEMVHPNAQAGNLRLSWDISGITPDLKRLAGRAKIHSSGGRFTSLGDVASESKWVKVLIMPLMVFQKIGALGGIKLFPDFNNMQYTELAGDYVFKDGVMTLKDSHVYSEAAAVSARGTIDIPAEKLNLLVTTEVGKIVPIEIEVRGSFEKPSIKPKIGKFLADPAKRLLEEPAKQILGEPAKQLLENIFKKK